MRSLRSGDKPYEVKWVQKVEYLPKPRDYSAFLDATTLDSDREDTFEEREKDFQQVIVKEKTSLTLKNNLINVEEKGSLVQV